MPHPQSKNFGVAFATLCLALFQGAGCLSGDTTGDNTQSEMNRQNAVADKVDSQYEKIKGQFAGTYNASDVLLTLDVARQTSTGNGDLSLVPQPTLIGSLGLTPKIFVADSGQPMTIPFSVTAGQYVNGSDLTLTVQQNGNPTVLHCKVADMDELDCNWYVNASTAPRVSFQLSRIAQGQALESTRNRLDGVYEGGNADYAKISAQFRTFLEPQSGSLAVPQVSIVGSFIFSPRPTADQARLGLDPGSANFPFTDSEYDPISNTLAIKINGSNPIEVNCTVKSLTSLHCSWIGTHGTNSYEDFDLNKSN